MKRKVAKGILLLSLICLQTACHSHSFSEATCEAPATCTECGETQGEPLGHNWAEATCESPKNCTNCGKTEGAALGHHVEEWTVTTEATCSTPGVESGVCTTCGETQTREIPLKEHTPGDWVVTTQPTASEQGTRIKKCTVCGAELESEKFELSAEDYKAQCASISYDSLSRTPNDYQGRMVKFSGTVVQVCSEEMFYSTYRVATSGGYDDVIYITVNAYQLENRRILEDDYITFYGTFTGLMSYQTVLGATVTVPEVDVAYLD